MKVRDRSLPARMTRIATACSLTCTLPGFGIVLPVFGGSAFAVESTPGSTVEDQLHFETDIRPILREYCLDCHGAGETHEGGLDLRLVRFMQQGGDSGPAIDVEDPELSELLVQVESDAMPPGEVKLSDEKKKKLREWIESGAPTLRPEPESIGFGIPLTEEERAYWAYQPLHKPTVSMVIDGVHARSELDALFLAAMPEELTFAPEASRAALVRRVYLDLTGISPTFSEMERWCQSRSGDWYEQMVEEVLQSPHYGERWARHWLDAVGYADSDGGTTADTERGWAWKYRDYVIRSLNSDKPFDQFIREQIAGDELAGPKHGDWTDTQIDQLAATGFLRMAADGTGSGDNSAEARNKTIADTVQIVGSTLLSSSMHCAQCHDHRYDPISHVDYFALRSVLEPALDWQNWRTPGQRLVSLYTQADHLKAAEIEAEAQLLIQEKGVVEQKHIQEVLDEELSKRPEELRESLRQAHKTPPSDRSPDQNKLLEEHPSVNVTPGSLYLYRPAAQEELKNFDTRIAEVRAKKPVEEYVHALTEPENHSPVTKLFHRGDFNAPTRDVPPGRLAVLSSEGVDTSFEADSVALPTTGRRTAFANWLVSSEQPNPLFLRSMVNRIWMHHFGEGIVATPGDFGKLGAEPTHPEVLDWLALKWLENRWSLKELHKVILNSAVYRQSTVPTEAGRELDADNFYYSRKSMLRLEAEVIRDSLLLFSQTLDRRLYGTPLSLHEDETGQVRIDPAQTRRSLYVKWRRSQPVALLQSFDAPVMDINCDSRPNSTVPMQSLMLMNGDFSLEQSTLIAQRILQEHADLHESQVLASGPDRRIEFSDEPWNLPKTPSPQWLYGTGAWDGETSTLRDWEALAHYSQGRWHAGPEVPDAAKGWVLLTSQGGHPGASSHAAVRRWVAPRSGLVALQGNLSHGSPNGDGVKAIVTKRNEVVQTWSVHSNAVGTDLDGLAVEEGDCIDLIVDCLESPTSDSFSWPVSITLAGTDGFQQVFSSADGFKGPQPEYHVLPSLVKAAWREILLRDPSARELDMVRRFAVAQIEKLHDEPERIPPGSSVVLQVLANVCQMLVSSNEFLYVE